MSLHEKKHKGKRRKKPSGSPGNRFLLKIQNLKSPEVLADIQGAMQEVSLYKHSIQLMGKQTQNSLTLEVTCGKLKSSQTTISPGLETRSK